MRESAPLGAALTTASVEEPTPEEEEEEEEEEGEDEDEGHLLAPFAKLASAVTVVTLPKRALQRLTAKMMSKKTPMMKMTL